MSSKRSGLQLDERPEFHRRQYRIQKVGWALFGCVVAASLAGLFGTGPLASTSARTSGGAAVEYKRFLTSSSRSELRMDLPPGIRSVALSREFLDAVRLEGFMPPALSTEAESTAIRFSFPSSGRVTAHYEAARIGRVRGAVVFESAGAVEIRQFFFP